MQNDILHWQRPFSWKNLNSTTFKVKMSYYVAYDTLFRNKMCHVKTENDIYGSKNITWCKTTPCLRVLISIITKIWTNMLLTLYLYV